MRERAGYIQATQGITEVKRAFANIATNTPDGEVVASETGKSILVLAVVFVCGATATNATFNSKPDGGAGAAISMLFANGANGGACLPYCEHGWFKTVAGEGLTLATSAGGSTTGVQVIYVEV